MDEAEKEYKKMYDRINDGREAMKVGTPFLRWRNMLFLMSLTLQ